MLNHENIPQLQTQSQPTDCFTFIFAPLLLWPHPCSSPEPYKKISQRRPTGGVLKRSTTTMLFEVADGLSLAPGHSLKNVAVAMRSSIRARYMPAQTRLPAPKGIKVGVALPEDRAPGSQRVGSKLHVVSMWKKQAEVVDGKGALTSLDSSKCLDFDVRRRPVLQPLWFLGCDIRLASLHPRAPIVAVP
jgi:hypothetical protein